MLAPLYENSSQKVDYKKDHRSRNKKPDHLYVQHSLLPTTSLTPPTTSLTPPSPRLLSTSLTPPSPRVVGHTDGTPPSTSLTSTLPGSPVKQTKSPEEVGVALPLSPRKPTGWPAESDDAFSTFESKFTLNFTHLKSRLVSLEAAIMDSFSEVAAICTKIAKKEDALSDQLSKLEILIQTEAPGGTYSGREMRSAAAHNGGILSGHLNKVELLVKKEHLGGISSERDMLAGPISGPSEKLEICSPDLVNLIDGPQNAAIIDIDTESFLQSQSTREPPSELFQQEWRAMLRGEVATLEAHFLNLSEKVEQSLQAQSIAEQSMKSDTQSEIVKKRPSDISVPRSDMDPGSPTLLPKLKLKSEVSSVHEGTGPMATSVCMPTWLRAAQRARQANLQGRSRAVSQCSVASPIRSQSDNSPAEHSPRLVKHGHNCTDPVIILEAGRQQKKVKIRTSKNFESFNPMSSVATWVFSNLGMRSGAECQGLSSTASCDWSSKPSRNSSLSVGLSTEGAFATLLFGTDERNVLENENLRSEKNVYKDGHWATTVATDPRFTKLALWMIFLHAVCIGVEADASGAHTLYSSHWFFIITSNLFTAFYLLEWTIHWMAFRRKRFAITRASHAVDTILCFFAVMDTWFFEPIIALFFYNIQQTMSIAVVGFLRTLRIARLIRVVINIPALLTLTRGIVMATKAVFWTFVLVVVITYMFGIVLHTLLKNDTKINELMLDRNFETLASTMWTLLIDGALLTEFGEKMTLLKNKMEFKAGLTCIIMTCYMFIAALTILNMLIGVMNEVVIAMTAREKTESAIELVRHTILRQLAKFDDGNGLISRRELERVMEDEECDVVLRSLNVDRLFLLELQALLFPNTESAVSISRVVELMLLCRGDNVTTVRTLASGLLYISSLIHKLETNLEEALGVAPPSNPASPFAGD